MAEKKPPIKDLTNFYSDLAFFPKEDKNTLWISQQLFYAKLAGVRLLDEKKCNEYRKLDKLEINEQEYIDMIDPATEMDADEKSRAKYFAADFKTVPIDSHIDNIIKAKIKKIPDQLVVDVIDKFSKIQKQKDKEKIIYQREFRELINRYNEMLGIPKLKAGQTPYKYVQSLQPKEGEGSVVDSVDNLLDYIKSQIRDEHDLALYEEYIYKGDVEIALELGIQHFLINLNKWKVEKWEWYINDLKNFNKASGTWYIDETNGRGTAAYVDPKSLWTSPFKAKNGEDIIFWFHEPLITFAEFVRRFGEKLTDEQLKEVFELNKIQGGGHRMTWAKAWGAKGSNALIQIGEFSVLTQDAENFSLKYVNGTIPSLERKPLDWKPEKNDDGKKEQRIYNVWYSCYYVPPPSSRLQNNVQADWAWQSQYIFDLKKDIDMYRYGVDMRYAKSKLVIWKDETRPSFTDIKESFMPKIRTLWHKFQNCIINDVSGVFIANDIMGGVLKAVDEANKINGDIKNRPSGGNGTDAGLQAFRMMRQAGFAMHAFRDLQGNEVVDPSKLFIPYDNKMLDKAEKYLKIMLDTYHVMTISLAQNDLTEGQDATPRTASAAITASLSAANNGIWFLEEPSREFMIMYAERVIQHIFNIVKEKKNFNYKDRWEEFKNVIGMANAMMLEEIEDIPAENIGITVTMEDVSANQNYIFELANKMADEKLISYDAVGLITETVKHNYKYAYVLLILSAKNKAREDAHKEEIAFQRQMQLAQQQEKSNMALIGAKGQAKNQNIMTEGKVQAIVDQQMAKLKAEYMKEQKEQLLHNKLIQDGNKSELNKDTKTHESNLKAQEPLTQ